MLIQDSPTSAQFATSLDYRITRALDAIRGGIPVVLLDDFERENEADLTVAAEKLTVPAMAIMIREGSGSGIVCLCLTADTVQTLDLPPMVMQNDSPYGTSFTVTIEAREGVTTGVTAADRVTTIRAAAALGAQASDLRKPGHVFPLRAAPGGVLARRGHTEGSVDLATLAGLQPAAVLCELMNADGTMMRGAAIDAFAALHGMPMLSIADIVAWRTR